MNNTKQISLDDIVGHMGNIFNEKMSLYGMIRETSQEGKYRLDIFGDNGYYCFSKEDVITIKKENSISISLK